MEISTLEDVKVEASKKSEDVQDVIIIREKTAFGK